MCPLFVSPSRTEILSVNKLFRSGLPPHHPSVPEFASVFDPQENDFILMIQTKPSYLVHYILGMDRVFESIILEMRKVLFIWGQKSNSNEKHISPHLA